MAQVQQTIDATISTVASKATGAGSAVSVWGWLTASDIGMWLGILVGVSGLVVNWYFKRREDQRAEKAHQAFMRKMELPGMPPEPEKPEADE